MAASTRDPRKQTKTSFDEFTNEDKQLAREAWMLIECNYSVVTEALFTELFRKHPEFIGFFKGSFFAESDDWKTTKFINHMVKTLMPSLGGVIRNLDEVETIIANMKQLGKIHKKLKLGIKKQHVEILKATFVQTVDSFIGPNMLPQKAALAKVFSFAFNIFELEL